MLSERQVRLLRIAVIAMGVVLLVGFAVVISRIVYLLNRAPVDVPAAPAAGAAQDFRLALPQGAVVRHLSLHGNRLAIHHESAAGAAITIVDLAAGRAVQRIDLTPQPAR